MGNDDLSTPVPRAIRRTAVTLIGGLITAAGVLMLFLPPLPGLVVTASGLGLLSTEYAWARRLKHSAEMRLRRSRRND